MIYWGIVFLILVIVGVILGVTFNKSGSEICAFGSIVSGVIAFIIALAMLITVCEYRSFLSYFEIQRTIVTQIHPTDDNSLFYVADMIEANQELAKMQGSKKAWGGWCMYPDSVMDITPIGVE